MATIYPRRILDVIHRRIRTTPVVILEGPRAVGKSTLLQEVAAASKVGIVDLDEIDVKHRVESDPQGYVTRRRPVLIDEYPKVPDLLQHVKAQLNKDGSPGQFVLTGSASREANRSGLDALVGRHVDVPVLPLAQSEIEGRGGNFIDEAFTDIEAIRSSGPSETDRESYVRKVLTGGFPLMLRSLDLADRHQQFKHYIDQSINYGLANLYEIREREHLERLLYRYAAQTGQLLNIRSAARDVELKRGTAENYTRLLELLFLIYRLPAWKATDQGPVSRPKLHMVDSGVGGRLLRLTAERIGSGEPLFRGQYGHLLETFVLGEVRKMITWIDGHYEIGYWRDREGSEVDLVVERSEDEMVIGLEVKAASRVRSDDWKGLRLLRDRLGPRFRAGLVMYAGEMPYRLHDRIHAIPIDKLWKDKQEATCEPVLGGRTMGTGVPMSTTPSRRRLLTADGDPLSEAVRSATSKMIDRLEIGDAAYWEVAVTPSENVHFGDFYTSAGVAGALQRVGWNYRQVVEPIDQCVSALLPGQWGALIHPLGSMVTILVGAEVALGMPPGSQWIGAVSDRTKLTVDSDMVAAWALGLARFSHDVLLPHGRPDSWTCWSAGRRLRSGGPVPVADLSPFVGTRPVDAVVDDPPHKGIPLVGDPEAEAFQIKASFFEWFGIPAGRLPEADRGRISADHTDWWST